MLKKEYYLYGPSDGTIPVVSNFGDYFVKRLVQNGDTVAFTNAATGSKLTYKQIAQQGMNLAVSLSHLGVRKGETVAMCTENREEFWATLVGVICVGAVFTPYNPGYTSTEMKHILSISKPKYLFVSPIAFKLHEKTFRSSNLKKIIIFGDNNHGNVIAFNELVTPVLSNEQNIIVNNRLTRDVNLNEFLTVDVDKNDMIFILYSSGTTGMPKGVMLTHFNIATTCCSQAVKFTGKKILSLTPWFHAMGLSGTLVGLSAGKSYVTLPKFDIDLYLKTIEKYKVDQLFAVPPILVALSKYPAKYDLTSVIRITCGAAPLYSDTIEAIREKFPNAPGVLQGYGCTEATIAISTDEYIEGRVTKTGSCGKVSPCTVVKIVDLQTRKPLGPNKEGEICVKGAMIMKGYIGRDRSEDFDEEGFFKTGDIGYHDDDGYIYIVDRLKELIKYKAYQVAPAEIEAVLLQHSAVRDVGVVGVPDRRAGEIPRAFVVLQPEKAVTELELKKFVAEKLSNPKHLRGGVRFVSEIPKNPSGKILRKVLRNMAKNEKSRL